MAEEPKKSNLNSNLMDIVMTGGAITAGVLIYNYLQKQTGGTGPGPQPGGNITLGKLTLEVT